MKTDKNGCSACLLGKEQYETFTHRGEKYYQYDYRHANGELFSCVKPTLEECREECNKWINDRF